jgi:hypothetical protein
MHDGGVVQRICITEEMAGREQPLLGREQSECKLKSHDRSGNFIAPSWYATVRT